LRELLYCVAPIRRPKYSYPSHNGEAVSASVGAPVVKIRYYLDFGSTFECEEAALFAADCTAVGIDNRAARVARVMGACRTTYIHLG
jgi:hypothetical protein